MVYALIDLPREAGVRLPSASLRKSTLKSVVRGASIDAMTCSYAALHNLHLRGNPIAADLV